MLALNFLLDSLIYCIQLPDFDEFAMCLDTAIIEYNRMIDEEMEEEDSLEYNTSLEWEM